jgi:hypothetical protein
LFNPFHNWPLSLKLHAMHLLIWFALVQWGYASELKHLCYFEPKNLPATIGRVKILDPNALHPDNLERALVKSLATNPDHLQCDVETKGLPFKKAFPDYNYLTDFRSDKTMAILKRLSYESIDDLQGRFPRYPFHFWVNNNLQANRDAILRLDNDPSLLRLGAIADVECFYNSKQSIASWERKQLAPDSRIRQFRQLWPGPACLAVNINDHFNDREPFRLEVLEAYERVARALKFEYIGWHVFNNDAMAYGDFEGPELAHWREVVTR